MKLNFKEFGEGRPLIILHGLLGSLDNWQTLARRFGEHFKVYTIDLRNHGQSPHSEAMNYEVLSSDILEFLNDRMIEETAIIGHSMGGKTAMKFALDHGEKVTALVVADICPKKYLNRNALVLETLSKVDFTTMRGRKEVDEFLMSKIKDRATVAFLSKNIYWKEEDKLDFRFNLKAIIDNVETINDWPETGAVYNAPALFVRAEKADYIGIDEPSILQHFPMAKTISIDSGHWLHAEKPDEFFAVVSAFLKA